MASSSSIITRTFSAGSTQPLLLRGNEFTQRFAVAEHWTRMRVGILCAFPPTPGNANIQGGTLKIGFCSYGKSCCSENAAFLGYGFGAQGGTLITYVANSGNPYFSVNGHNGVMRLGTSYTTQTNGSFNATVCCSDPVNPRRGILISDVLKAAGSSSSLTAYSDATAHAAFDLGPADLYNAVEQVAATPVVRGSSLTVSNVQNSGFTYSDLTYGYLNTVNIHWNHWLWPLEIYSLAVYLEY